jgi:hypothetical protein
MDWTWLEIVVPVAMAGPESGESEPVAVVVDRRRRPARSRPWGGGSLESHAMVVIMFLFFLFWIVAGCTCTI